MILRPSSQQWNMALSVHFCFVCVLVLLCASVERFSVSQRRFSVSQMGYFNFLFHFYIASHIAKTMWHIFTQLALSMCVCLFVCLSHYSQLLTKYQSLNLRPKYIYIYIYIFFYMYIYYLILIIYQLPYLFSLFYY